MPQFDTEIANVIIYLQSAFGTKLADEQFKVYVRSLGSVNMIKLQAAAEKIVRESLYFPRVAEILKVVNLIPDRNLNQSLMLDHQRKVKVIKDRFYRTRELDHSALDALYQELRECGYWAKAEYLRELERRWKEQATVDSRELTVEGLKAVG
jgi:hypothetical protein